ncbi:hypothetical protein CHL78_008675 [Romboutsia weinsteinii]|uniref:Lipoprotein n=1 Tax=Romboutsia weinsteinii TaxID=2020949 RepID=A0A371J417_9FIRM|nr:hypothetical protein [Romboutsia weinsteinii]RDY27530.1 hypothetical protein CHL78_008675 [Romboutsia weinsteinii]
MKSKRLKRGYISLVIISLLMITVVSILSCYNNKNKLTVNDLQGNKKNIGDIKLVYTPNTSYFNYEEITLNKYGLNSKPNMKFPINRDYMDSEKDYTPLHNWDEDRLIYYSSKEYIGTANFTYYDEDINSNKRNIKITQKNLNTNKDEDIEISIRDDRFNGEYVGVHFNVIYKDKLYMILNQGPTDDNGSDRILVLEINLKNKTGKIVASYNPNKIQENSFWIQNIIFINKGKIYILGMDNIKNSSKFIIYDIENNKFTESNNFLENSKEEGYAKDKEMLECTVIEDRIVFILLSNNHTGSKVSQYTYKVNSDEVKLESIKNTSLQILNKSYIKKLTVSDDKIYMISQGKNETTKKLKNGKSFKMYGVKSVNFTIFDISKNKVVYEAELNNSDTSLASNLYFLKD